MRTLAIINQKGGCGKTTTSINLAGVLAAKGYRTLLVDLDPQGHCAAGLAIPEQRVDLSIGDAMMTADEQPIDPERLLWRVSRNLDLAPSTVRLAALEAARGELASRPDAETRLKSVLKRFDGRYDLCLIDCSPAIGLLAFNALVAADEVIIPVETGFFSLQGATKQVNTIKAIGKRLGVAPGHRLLATMHDPSSALSQDLLEELRRRFANRVIPVVIRFDQALRESASFGQPVIEYARESAGAQDYSALGEWVIGHILSGDGSVVAETVAPVARPSTPRVDAPASTVDLGSTLEPASFDGGVTVLARPTIEPTLSRAADVLARARRMSPAASPETTSAHAISSAPATTLIETKLSPAATPAHASQPAFAAAPSPSAAPATFGVRVAGRTATFVQPVSIGQEVAIAGEFNDWRPERTPMRANPTTGMLEAVAEIPPGTWQYRLVVDGRWMPDAFNPVTSPNPFGGINSVVHVPQPLTRSV